MKILNDKMPYNLSIIVCKDQESEPYSTILNSILNSNLPKSGYEIIFLGRRQGGFVQATLYKEHPLVRGFYDDVLNRSKRINMAVQEANCAMIMIWPGLYFMRSNFQPIPDDVVSQEYYLMLDLRINRSGMECDLPWPLGCGMKPIFNPFRPVKYKYNLKDTLRFMYKIGECPWRVQVWYFGCIMR